VDYQINSKNKNGYEKISRRSFLKYTGTIIFVVGAGCYVPAEKGTSNLIKLNEKRGEIPPSHGYLLVDIRKCQGCTSCMLACTLVHEGVENPSLSRIQIIQNPFKSFPGDLTIEQCRQCVDPACVKVCPEDALRANAGYGNVRMIR
jgi:protein NrfC